MLRLVPYTLHSKLQRISSSTNTTVLRLKRCQTQKRADSIFPFYLFQWPLFLLNFLRTGASSCWYQLWYRLYIKHQSINQTTDKQPTNQQINKWTNQSMNWSINQSINQQINQSMNWSINQSINQQINQSINQSFIRTIDQSILSVSVLRHMDFWERITNQPPASYEFEQISRKKIYWLFYLYF